MKLNKTLLSWSVPFSVHRPNAIEGFRQAFPPMAFVRIIALFTVIFVVIRALLLRKYPLIEVEWLELYVICIASIFGFIFLSALSVLAPPQIRVTEKGIVVQQGSGGGIFYSFSGIASLRIEENSKPFPLFKISFLDQKPDKEIPIPATISIPLLKEILNQKRVGH